MSCSCAVIGGEASNIFQAPTAKFVTKNLSPPPNICVDLRLWPCLLCMTFYFDLVFYSKSRVIFNGLTGASETSWWMYTLADTNQLMFAISNFVLPNYDTYNSGVSPIFKLCHSNFCYFRFDRYN